MDNQEFERMFIERQIAKGNRRIIITNRGEKVGFGKWAPMWETFTYHIDTFEDYQKIVNDPVHTEHAQGFSVGYAPA